MELERELRSRYPSFNEDEKRSDVACELSGVSGDEADKSGDCRAPLIVTNL